MATALYTRVCSPVSSSSSSLQGSFQCVFALQCPNLHSRRSRVTRGTLRAEKGAALHERKFETEDRTRTVVGFSRQRNSRNISRSRNAVEGEEIIIATAQTPDTALVDSRNEGLMSVEDIKAALSASLEGLNRGIFGVQNARKAEVETLLQLLESANPSPRPTDNLDKVEGAWKLLYSTISILGSKRTKLGLRDFITLGDFVQIIDVHQAKAVNKVVFSVAGLKLLSGSFTIEASYNVASPTRVNIQFERSSIVPEQLMSLFKTNYDLLLSIFNPEGWLEITYVDDTLRVGRDDKGNIFLVERM